MNVANLEIVTYVGLAIIVGATIWGYLYVKSCTAKNKLTEKRRWIEQIPTLISTLGVLGTFAGITIGLLNFDTANLDTSIPLLLSGLKTAFFTSLAGMLGSLILSKLVSNNFDEQDGGVSDINMAAGEIVKAVKEMSQENCNTLKMLQAQAAQQAKDQAAFYVSMNNFLKHIEAATEATNTNIASITLQTQAQTTSLTSLAESAGSMLVSVGNIEDNADRQTQSLANIQSTSNTTASRILEMANNIGELVDASSALVSTEGEIADEVKQFGQKLHAEVIEIEDKMEETNSLLERKFNEFTELLKKSNTEALVEVMKNVTTEFQKQMNALINKLIQENFDQLNKSVEKLNTWQQENKEMISSLTKQYKDMATSFENTSTTLTKVGTDTRTLVSDGGKLKQLIDSLNKVLIEDKNFIEITKKLDETVELTKDNMAKFDESTNSLNNWIRKQRNFVDGVTLLIEKLDELNKIRSYNEQFWQGTKRSLEEGVAIITEGSKSLNNQLRNLDAQFYARLSATLAELDTCIQAMVNGNTRR